MTRFFLAAAAAMGLLALFTSSVYAADPRPAADGPTRAKQALDWYAATTVDAYDAVGLRDPKWDKAARDSINAAALQWSGYPTANGDQAETALNASVPAYQAGCRDPLLLYVRGMGLLSRTGGRELAVPLLLESAEGMRNSRYAPVRKCYAYARAAQQLAYVTGNEARKTGRDFNPAAMKRIHNLSDDAVATLREVFADPMLPVGQATDLVDMMGTVSQAVYGNPKRLPEHVFTAAEAGGRDESFVLTMKGQHHIHVGWQARGNATADQVADEGWTTLKTEIELARKALTKAWELDNANWDAATLMISVELGDSKGRAEMERWYKRAMTAWPDNRKAVEAKMWWLDPRWHGSAEEMIAFGRELRDGGRWEALLPLQLVQAHWAAAVHTAAGMKSVPNRAYFEEAPGVWEELKPVYEEFFTRVKGRHRFHRTRYAVIAAWTGHWADADKMFKEIGPYPAQNVLYDKALIEQLRMEAADKAAAGITVPRPEGL